MRGTKTKRPPEWPTKQTLQEPRSRGGTAPNDRHREYKGEGSRVMVQAREMQYTHHHDYDSDYVPTLRQRKHRSQRNDLQLQATLFVQGLRQELSREPPAKRLYRREARGDP